MDGTSSFTTSFTATETVSGFWARAGSAKPPRSKSSSDGRRTRPSSDTFRLFWDFQGAEKPEDLHESLSDSLLDAMDRLEAIGVPLERVEADDLFESINRLRRELRTRELALLLLGDEVEELITINENEPRFLRRLRRALQSAENIRTVLASKIKLWELANEDTTTSPFLHGFTPPHYVFGIDDDAARALIRQSNLPEASRPEVDERTMETIRERCNNHPYLLQIVCERYMELGDLDKAIEEIAADQMVRHFFAVDFEMLSETERNIIRIVSARREVDDGFHREHTRGELVRAER